MARLTGYDYDGRGMRSRVTEGHLAAGAGFSTAGSGPRTTLTEYDANGNLRRVVDPSGVTMTGTGINQVWAPTNPDVIGDNLTSTARPTPCTRRSTTTPYRTDGDRRARPARDRDLPAAQRARATRSWPSAWTTT